MMEHLGSRQARKDMYFSPFREEKAPSVHVDPVKNVWYDHGLGVGGNVVKLVMLAKHLSEEEARRYIEKLDPSYVEKTASEQTIAQPKSSIVKVQSVDSRYLLDYCEERGIPRDIARAYCSQVTVYNPNRNQRYTVLGFLNNAGGYALRSPSGFKSTDKSGITTINTKGERSVVASSAKVAVFEGFFDYMSWQVLSGSKTPVSDVLVLNSVNNMQRGLEYIKAHAEVDCYLDRDTAGKRTLADIQRLCPDQKVNDQSEQYAQHKDLNEMLMASLEHTQSIKHQF